MVDVKLPDGSIKKIETGKTVLDVARLIGAGLAKTAIAALPERIDGEVYWCGFASKDSYGAQSYFIRRNDGNVLVDSPRYAAPIQTVH